MRLAVFSHKVCWTSVDSPSKFATDGGFSLQMEAISELFTSTNIIVPCKQGQDLSGLSPLKGKGIRIVPLTVPTGIGFRRKIYFPLWLLRNGGIILREVRSADAVHSPIPGDVGTIGMIFSQLLRKPLFVRHCGNWLVQRTAAERFWKWSMEKFAGGRNVMLATGGADEPPSRRNSNVKWIFSTSLRREQMVNAVPRELPADGKLRLIIACRQEEKKGTDIVIESLPIILNSFPEASLDIVGGGSLLERLNRQAASLGLADRVTFHGKVAQSAVLDLLKKAHLFCYPTSASEGFPKVVLEALANGLPVITTRVSVLPKLIGNGGGVLVDEPTAIAVGAAVVEICRDNTNYKRMSSKAIETARQYTLESWRDSIGEILRAAWGKDFLILDKGRAGLREPL